ncbi:hypothetical protein CEUSTIGMA_g5631.t1 [Chlamydomonas eustigma]|uniref:phosphoribosylanthranilate isomerase n=1 Tax=Chlamydomonas eustigma TaxID=1157962 RepID=A0A250X5J4_9CHLO|nr:hypothetical protein CEUSTIGMA_g5631.t1 [Chlamydomonas eustigma]|eukprot:GAX78189.1 hypothetical protein CEUSTIGMA_g5631.t1 [Chlamydomonas eustigma]
MLAPCSSSVSLKHHRLSINNIADIRIRASRSGASTQIKICGVVSPEDASLAAQAGADFIGMIMWPKAKRSVSDDTAAKIAQVAARHGCAAVGVFVDEDPETINRRCEQAGIHVAQLHGDGARSSLPGLSTALEVIYVLHAQPDGNIVTPLPESMRTPEWLLVDGLQGGSGQALKWSELRPPPEHARKSGWLLAGGLRPGNVEEAVRTTRPSVVDVSSGVCGPDGLLKDHDMITSFVAAVKHADVV